MWWMYMSLYVTKLNKPLDHQNSTTHELGKVVKHDEY